MSGSIQSIAVVAAISVVAMMVLAMAVGSASAADERDAGLEPVDVWAETRERVVPPDALADRMDAVATHLWADLPDEDQRDVLARVRALFRGAAGPDGMYRYRFVKTFAVAVKPG